jgi:hypothetical protein
MWSRGRWLGLSIIYDLIERRGPAGIVACGLITVVGCRQGRRRYLRLRRGCYAGISGTEASNDRA